MDKVREICPLSIDSGLHDQGFLEQHNSKGSSSPRKAHLVSDRQDEDLLRLL